MRRTTLITCGCIAVLSGLGLARWLALANPWWLIVLPGLLVIRKNQYLKLVLVIIAGLCLGLWRGSFYMQKSIDLEALSGRKVTIAAAAKTDAIYGKRSQIEFIANNAQLLRPDRKPLAGSFKISGFGVPMVYRGDTVEVTGKLFTMRGSNQARMAYTQIRITAPGGQWFDKFSRHFATGMQNALPEPQGPPKC
jgi:hypothetical protein